MNIWMLFVQNTEISHIGDGSEDWPYLLANGFLVQPRQWSSLPLARSPSKWRDSTEHVRKSVMGPVR